VVVKEEDTLPMVRDLVVQVVEEAVQSPKLMVQVAQEIHHQYLPHKVIQVVLVNTLHLEDTKVVVEVVLVQLVEIVMVSMLVMVE
jgi:hypothetical protein